MLGGVYRFRFDLQAKLADGDDCVENEVSNESEHLCNRNTLGRLRLGAWRGEGDNRGAIDLDQSEFSKQPTHACQAFV